MPAFKLTYTIQQLQEYANKEYGGDIEELATDMALSPWILEKLFYGALVHVAEGVEDPKALLRRIVERWATLTYQDRQVFIPALEEDLLAPPLTGPDLEALTRVVPAYLLH